MMDFDVTADGEELFAFRHVNAGGNDELLGSHMKVEAAPGGLFESAARPPRPLVAFVGPFVRREANIAIDAHRDLLRRLNVVRCKAKHGFVDSVDKGMRRSLHLALVDRFSGVEPFTVVIALEAAHEFESFRRVMRCNRGHEGIVNAKS